MNLERAAFIILGIRNADDPAILLGIPHWDGSVTVLEAAIRKRVAQILSHPMRYSDEANLVQDAIQEAGVILAKQCHSQTKESIPNPVTHELTVLDRSIIAVLVSEGGWNRQSRSRLVAVSAAYGLTVGGLLRILTALAESARSGRGPMSQKSRKINVPDRSWASLPISKKKQSVVDDLMDEVASKFLPELKEHSTVSTIKLSIIFGLLTILAIVLGLKVLNRADTEARRAAALLAESTRLMQHVSPPNSALTQLQQKNCFSIYPTFDEEIFTVEIGELVDVVPEIPSILRNLQYEIESANAQAGVISNDLIREWEKSIDTVSSVWPFIDKQLQDEIGTLILEIIAESPHISGLTKQLLLPFQRIVQEGDAHVVLIKRPWAFGELSRLACSDTLLPSTTAFVKEVTRKMVFDCDVYQMRREELRLLGIELASSVELSANPFLSWERWLAMVNRDTDSSMATRLKLQVINFIVKNAVYLTRESNTRQVLGRLLQEVDWIRSDLARESLLQMYSDERVSSTDLWAITNMLVDLKAIPWLKTEHLIEIDDEQSTRVRVSKDLQQLWPVVTQTKMAVHTLILPAGFDPVLISVWEELALLCEDTSSSPIERFAHARRLNEIAAAIWVGRSSRAWELVDNIDQATLYQDAIPIPAGGRSSGQLHQRFTNTNRDPDAMLELLNFIRSSAYTTLHVRDATTVVRAAFFYSDYEIREEAVKLICDHFAHSTEVAVAVVNVLTANAKTQQVESLVAYLTDEILPPRHESTWLASARRAFVQHALTAGNKELSGLDECAITVGISALGEALIVDPSRLRPTQEVTVAQSYEQLLGAWRKRVGIRNPLVNYDVADVLETHLKQQLEYVQLIQRLEVVWTGETLELDDLVGVTASQSLLEQITQAEMASLHVWKRMLRLANEEFLKGVTQ